ncbi:MAG: hypothetical protein IJW22_04875 [Clostridia bacterium]|nr:hypothetical protein [Clostridia bacterium]
MATLQNQGTLRFTPEGGMQSTAVSNITSTVFDVSYGLRVTHGVAPSLFGNGETLRYVVVMENTGSGMLSAPEIRVDLAGGVLSFVPDSAEAFLYTGADLVALPFAVSEDGSGLVFTFAQEIPAGGSILLVYDAIVSALATGDNIASTAIGTANEGDTTAAISDSDIATATRRPLSIVKSAPATAVVGESIQYTFTITNSLSTPIFLDDLSDQLPDGFRFTGISLSIAGTEVPLVATDYTLTPEGLLTLDPAATVILPAGEQAIVTVTGVVSA